jgi:DNA-binding transcriptional regulator LsrR (DeoR family)
MPMERTSMRKIREVLRLKYEKNLSNSKIGTSCNISRESVRNYLGRAKIAGKCLSRVKKERRDLMAFVGGIQSGLSQWLSVCAVL